MELRQLRYFTAVADERHFGRAAERLFMAQPPLSQQIQKLERELGVALFERTSRQVRLTPAGQALYDDSRSILAMADQAVQRARRAHAGELGWLNVAFVASATYDFLPQILRRFREAHPDVHVALYEMTAAEQERALRERRVDLAFCRPALDDARLKVRTVVTEPLVAALPADHALATIDALALGDLASQPFVLYPRYPRPSYADYIYRVCEEAGFVPQVAQEAFQMQTALSLVAAGIGVTLVPASAQNLRRSGVAYRPLADPAPTTDLSLAYDPTVANAVLERFLDVAATLAAERSGS